MPFALIFLIVFLIFFYGVRLLFIYLGLQKPVLYTNTIFGPIRPPQIKDSTTSAAFTLNLDTIEGEPVTATATARIYFLPQAATRFGYREKIYLIANTFGFNTEIIKHQLDGTEAKFSDFVQSLSIDITNFNFTYRFNFEKNTTLFSGATIATKEVAENKAIDFLKSVGRYPDELATGKRNISYLKYDTITNNLTTAPRIQDSNLVEVDFYRPDIEADPNALPMIAPQYPNSQNYVVMLFRGKEFKVLRAQVRFFEKSNEQVGIYPLKTGDIAWEQLRTGKGVVLNAPKNLQKVSIKTMFLAYLDPDFYQEYLQPVYVFLGQGNFVGYIPAVLDSYLRP